MRVIDQSMLLALVERAEQAPRRRMNLNLHDAPEDPVQRLFNAIEPDSYVRPHRHVEPARWELMLAVRGACALLAFEDDGVVSERLELVAGGGCLGAELPPGA
ncbi:MAG: WbuC family cupin fold metalloprotein, partial [Gammaproteobacteria bacterium]